MARNRKRAKERRARRPPAGRRARGAAARADATSAPDPLEHATPDVELAEAQLALGRPELSRRPSDDADDEALEDWPAEASSRRVGGGERSRPRGGGCEPSGAAAPGPAVRSRQPR